MKLTLLVVSFLFNSFNPIVKEASNVNETTQIECLTKAIYFEARGASIEGQAGVGQVVRNRVEHTKYPNSYCGVVYAKNQFTWSKYKNLKVKEPKAWDDAKSIAKITYYQGWPHSLVGNALYFHSGKPPYWANTFNKVNYISGISFYEEPYYE